VPGLVAGLLCVSAAWTARSEEGKPRAAADANREATPPITIRHSAATADGWSVAETTNFRLWHRASRAVAEQVLTNAERTRTAVFQKWFAEDGGRWAPRCEVCLYPSGCAYQEATGLPQAVPGTSQTRHDSGRIVSRRIDLRGDRAGALETVLPHEVAHVVLADRFDGLPVPCWANEGIAVLTEPGEQHTRHLRNLPRHRDEGRLFGVRALVELSTYPERHLTGTFYAQSVSLVQFLAAEKGPTTLTAFLRDARRSGLAPALQRHYGLDFEQLERRWRRHAFPPA
jgi:hypothetical protein